MRLPRFSDSPAHCVLAGHAAINAPLLSSPHPPHGLSSAYAPSALAAQVMGGRLLLESDGPGKGATTTLELPVSRSR
jgi:hypothetical protein